MLGWLLTVAALFCILIVSLEILPLLMRNLDSEPTLIIQIDEICSDAHLSATTENG